MSKHLLFAIALVPLLVTACDDPAGSDDRAGQVAIRFGTSPSARTSLNPSFARSGAADEVVVTGTNGTLRITDIRFIVSDFELEKDEGACEAAGTGEKGCKDFKAPPSFVQLPLGSGTVTVATGEVPSGSYTELEFEVEDVEVDDDDSDRGKSETIQKLLTTIRGTFSDWPNKASMLVAGTFTPAGRADPIPFRTYFEAEIEVEMDLVPPLTISETGASRSVTVDVQPALWFRSADGRVRDLSAFDFARTRKLLEFELELEKAFKAKVAD